MKTTPRHNGFSLLETLLAVGTLAIGMVFVAGTFLAGTFFTTLSTERTVAMTVADEAFAKIQLYAPGVQLVSTSSQRYDLMGLMPASEFTYPSMEGDPAARQYSWRALLRPINDSGDVAQCTVFVSRRVATKGHYYAEIPTNYSDPNASDYPQLLKIDVTNSSDTGDPNSVISILDPDEQIFINDGMTVVDDRTGAIYRVVERYADRPTVVELDRPWVQADGTEATTGALWVLSPALSGGRYPLVAVYQTVLEF